MRLVVSENFLGAATRHILRKCDEVLQVRRGFSEEERQALLSCFPLDKTIELDFETLSIDDINLGSELLRQRLPTPFAVGFVINRRVPTREALDGLLVSYFAILHEYARNRNRTKLDGWPYRTVAELSDGLMHADAAGLGYLSVDVSKVLMDYLAIVDSSENGVRRMIDLICDEVIPRTFRYCPHVVRVLSVSNAQVELLRCWEDTDRRTLKLKIDERLLDEVRIGRFYCMPPKWKRRDSGPIYRVDGREALPLSPAIFYEERLSELSARFRAYGELLELLGDPETAEASFRDLIAEHPWMIAPGSRTQATELRSRPALGRASPRVDLMLESGDGLKTIVEFKRPATGSRTELFKASQQVRGYYGDLRADAGHETRQMVLLIAGRDNQVNSNQKLTFEDLFNRIQLLTYDDLVRRVEGILFGVGLEPNGRLGGPASDVSLP